MSETNIEWLKSALKKVAAAFVVAFSGAVLTANDLNGTVAQAASKAGIIAAFGVIYTIAGRFLGDDPTKATPFK